MKSKIKYKKNPYSTGTFKNKSSSKPDELVYTRNFRSKQKFGAASPVRQINPITGEIKNNLCPTCHSRMVIRTARKGKNTGNSFWGCSNFPNCNTTINIAKK